jgi:MFS family permease
VAAGHDDPVTSPGHERALRAATLVFFVTGATYAAWATRIPAVQDRLDLSPGELALAIAGLEVGAIAGLPAGAALVSRIGSRAGLRVGFAAYPASLIAVAAAASLPALTAALAVMAVGNSVVDVAMNAQGVELERRLERPVLSRLHAGHPLGLVVGGAAGTAAAAAGAGPGVHFAAAALAGLLAGLAATRWLVRETAPTTPRTFVRPTAPLLWLGAVAFCATLVEGGVANWSAVHLRSERDAGAGTAAAAFTVFALAVALGRSAGDRLVARFGRLRVVQAGGLVAAVGLACAVAAPSLPAAFAGWALLGLGLACVMPAVIGAAPEVAGVPAPAAIAAVTTIAYLGSFTGPPLVGALAEAANLSTALGVLVAGSLLLAAVAPLGLRRSARR